MDPFDTFMHSLFTLAIVFSIIGVTLVLGNIVDAINAAAKACGA